MSAAALGTLYTLYMCANLTSRLFSDASAANVQLLDGFHDHCIFQTSSELHCFVRTHYMFTCRDKRLLCSYRANKHCTVAACN